MRLRRLLRLRRRESTGVTAGSASRGPSCEERRVSVPHPERLAAASTRSPRRTSHGSLDAFVTKTSRRCRARATRRRGSPRRTRDAELDRPAEPGNRRVRREHLPRSRARCPALGLGRRVLGRGLRAPSASGSTARRHRDDRAQPLVPERRGGARDCRRARRRGARCAPTKPLYAKLSPATWDVAESARAVAAAGADGLSLVNTIRGLALDAHARGPARARRRRATPARR